MQEHLPKPPTGEPIELGLTSRLTAMIVEAALDAVIVIDRSGFVVGWNRQATTLFGWSNSEALGRSLGELIVPARLRARHERGLRSMVEGGRRNFANKWVELTAIRRDGSEFPVEVGLAIHEVSGEILTCAFLRDITERKVLGAIDLRERSDLERLSKFSLELQRASGLTGLGKALEIVFGNEARSGALLVSTHNEVSSENVSIVHSWGTFSREKLCMPFHALNDSRESEAELLWGDQISCLLLRAENETKGFLCLENETWRRIPLSGTFSRSAIFHELSIALQKVILHEEVTRGNAKLQELTRQLLKVQEDERRHVAHELHDEIGQLITGLMLRLDLAGTLGGVQVATPLSEAQALVGDIMMRVRSIAQTLRPAVLDDFGLIPALSMLISSSQKDTGVNAELNVGVGFPSRFEPALETAAYRIIQEAMTNAARHALVDVVSIDLTLAGGCLCLIIEDLGQGMVPDRSGRRGVGLVGMEERARELGGSISISSRPGGGTRIHVRLPHER